MKTEVSSSERRVRREGTYRTDIVRLIPCNSPPSSVRFSIRYPLCRCVSRVTSYISIDSRVRSVTRVGRRSVNRSERCNVVSSRQIDGSLGGTIVRGESEGSRSLVLPIEGALCQFLRDVMSKNLRRLTS